MTSLDALWDFDDPAASEERFRAAAAAAGDAARADVLRTQVARALGLQGRFDEARLLLGSLTSSSPEVRTRVLLERGRVLRSSGESSAAEPLFRAAAVQAAGVGLDGLEVDALHMVALTLEGQDQVDATVRALKRARSSTDPAALAWEPSLLNNLGMACSGLGDWTRALAAFEEALALRRTAGDVGPVNVARWMVAWALRNLGRTDEALARQRDLKADLVAAGLEDPYVDEEIALLEGASRE